MADNPQASAYPTDQGSAGYRKVARPPAAHRADRAAPLKQASAVLGLKEA